MLQFYTFTSFTLYRPTFITLIPPLDEPPMPLNLTELALLRLGHRSARMTPGIRSARMRRVFRHGVIVEGVVGVGGGGGGELRHLQRLFFRRGQFHIKRS